MTKVSLMSWRLKLQLVFSPRRPTVCQTWKKSSMFFVNSFQQTYIVKLRNIFNFISSRRRWMKYFYSQVSYSFERILLTICKPLITTRHFVIYYRLNWKWEFQKAMFNSECPVWSPKTSNRLQSMLILLCRRLADTCWKVQVSQQQTLVYRDSWQCSRRL